ncbi:MAG: AAA family ATPase [Verrucomicrobia bacterium]|nr:AAA family ATPase [Verrucomicrobiota bacterium]
MAHPEKNEASLAGEASQMENYDEFRHKSTSSSDFITPNFGFSDDEISSKKRQNKPNFCLLVPSGGAIGALIGLRDQLKARFACEYIATVQYKGQICPIERREDVASFLKANGVNCTFEEVYLEYTKAGRIAQNEWSRIDEIEVVSLELHRQLLILEKESNCLSISEKASSDNWEKKRQIEELKIKLDKLEQEVQQRRNSARILEEKDQKNQGKEKCTDNQKPRSRLITCSYFELVAKEIPPREYVLKPWLPEAAISMIYAPPGVGKSYLCLSVAGAIASGGKLFKSSPWEAPKPRKVLFVDGEMHEVDLQTRVKKLMHDFEKMIPGENYLRYLNGSWQKVFIPDLSTVEGQEFIEEIIAEQGTQVLILDNLSTLCRSGKENETDSWKIMQAWLLQLRWRGITTILVHHAAKSKDENGKPRQRGTSMREVVLESSIVLDHPKDYSEEMGCVFELHYSKARGFYGASASPLVVRLLEINGVFCWEDRKLESKTYDHIVELYNEGITSTKDIASEIGISPQAVRKHIKKAKAKGDIV